MLAVTVGLGFYARRFGQTTSDLLVAARAVRPRLNAGAISGEYLSAASFLGVAGLVMQFGYDVLWYPVGYAAGYLVLLIFIAGPLRRFGAYTIPDFAEGRFDSPRFRRIAVCIVILIGLFYMLPQMKAAGITLAAATGAPYPVGVIAIALVVGTLVVSGGMGGITVVQAFQFAVKLFAITLPVMVLLILLGPPSQLFERLTGQPKPELSHTTSFLVHGGDVWTLTEPVTVRPDHAVVVKIVPRTTESSYDAPFFGVPVARSDPRDPADAMLVTPTGTELPAGRIIWTAENQIRVDSGSTAPFGNQTPPSTNAQWSRPFGPLAGGSGHPLLFTYSLFVGIVFGTMGLPHILVRFYTNPDGRTARRTAWLVLILLSLFYVWPPIYGVVGRLHAPQLYAGNLTDSVVLLLPRQLSPGLLGSGLTAVVSAGAFAAFASTLSGLLVSLSGALGHDIYGRWWKPNSTSDARRRAFRGAALVASSVAATLGLTVQSFDISILVGWAFAIAASSFFPLLVLGIWWRRLSTLGAALGATIGALMATIGIVLTMLQQVSPDLTRFLASHSDIAMLLAQPAIVTIPLAFAVMVIVSVLAPAANQGVSMKMLQMHVPERLGLRRDYIPE